MHHPREEGKQSRNKKTNTYSNPVNKKHISQLEDNTYVKCIADSVGNNDMYQVYLCIELFDDGLWCLHEIKITSFSIVIFD